MTIDSYERMFSRPLAPEVAFAGRFLESRGMVFGEDFGVTDAISRAALVIMSEIQQDFDYGV